MGNYFFSEKHEVKADSVKERVCVRESKRDRWLWFGVCVCVRNADRELSKSKRNNLFQTNENNL